MTSEGPPPLAILPAPVTASGQGNAPLHMQVHNALTKAIEEHFENGQQFWTEHALIEHLNLSRITVRRALDDMAREGVLMRTPRRGSFVLKNDTSPILPSVGIFVPDWGSDILTAMLEQLAVVCAERGRQLHVYHTHKGEKVANALRGLEHPPQRESILLFGNPHHTTVELFRTLQKRGYRIVNAATHIEELDGSSVSVDGAEGIRLGVEHLVSLGHERIAFLVNEPMANSATMQRVRAFEREMLRHGLDESQVVDCGTQYWEDSFGAAYDKMPEVWALRPTAIFTVSDPGAWAVGKWFAEQGIRVPGEVSLMGFDDVRPSRFMHPGLTTIAHPLADIARRALDMLDEPESEARAEELPPRLVVRQSTSFPRGR
jgi:LacI family transcriptional regulator